MKIKRNYNKLNYSKKKVLKFSMTIMGLLFMLNKNLKQLPNPFMLSHIILYIIKNYILINQLPNNNLININLLIKYLIPCLKTLFLEPLDQKII